MTSPQPAHPGQRKLTEAFFAGALEPAKFDALFAHLRDCPPCRGHFEKLRGGHRALSRPHPGLTRPEADLLRQQLLAEVGGRPPLLARLWQRWAIGVAALAAGVGALLISLPHPVADELARKGAGARPRVLIQVLCMTRVGSEVKVSSLAPPPQTARCPVGSYLMVSSAGPRVAQHLALVVLDESRQQRLLARIENPESHQLLEGYVPLTSPGRLAMVALATRSLLGDEEALASARRLAHEGDPTAESPSHTLWWIEVTP